MRRFLFWSLLVAATTCSGRSPTNPDTMGNGARATGKAADEQPARPGTRVVAPRSPVQTVSLGAWGGVHVSLLLTATGGTLEYDCAHGTIDQPFVIDSAGRFQLAGTHTREHGGPIRKDERPDTHPARYNGAVDGDTMTLTVTRTDSNEVLGTFTLTRGRMARVVKCL
jgi:hypothetical protein